MKKVYAIHVYSDSHKFIGTKSLALAFSGSNEELVDLLLAHNEDIGFDSDTCRENLLSVVNCGSPLRLNGYMRLATIEEVPVGEWLL